MGEIDLSTNGDSPEREPVGPFVVVAGAVIAGVLLGWTCRSVALWLVVAIPLLLMAVLMHRRGRAAAAGRWAVLAAAAATAAWTVVREHRAPSNDIRRFVTAESQLAVVRGRVDGPVYLSLPERGAMGRFGHQTPATLIVLGLDSVRAGGAMRPASGKLVVKIQKSDHRVRTGDRIEASGWLSAIDGPSNPGEMDYRAMLAQRGVYGRLTLRGRENWRQLGGGWARGPLDALGERLSERAAASLRIGMGHDPQRLAFLETLLLGRWSADLDELDDSFRRVGLLHILVISGAHLTILLGVAWVAARVVSGSPRAAAAAVALLLLGYLLTVPGQVPVRRAGVMAAAFCAGYAAGRRVRGIDMLALSAAAVLIWRPYDLFSAGCQLSFAGVGALLLFTRGVSRWVWPDPLVPVEGDRTRHWLLRKGSDILAASLVAGAVTLPLIAYHFGAVTPLAAALSMMAMPVITGALVLGFVKTLAGFVLPSIGVVLAGPLEWLADSLRLLVVHAAGWPASYVELRQPASLAWTAAALAVAVAAFTGWFARRKAVGAAALALCVAWLFWPDAPRRALARLAGPEPPTVSLTMFAVGDGSCFLARLREAAGSAEHVVMFDCGSQQYLDAGSRSIAPALRRTGVSRIDTLVVSHADLDHFSGVLDVADRVPIGRALVSPQFIAETEAAPYGAAAFLVRGLQDRGVPIEAVSRGWRERLAGADCEMLWPPADFRAPRANDTSLVLSIRRAGRRVLLNGDIQEPAITELLRGGGDLRADITDLPHHGGFGESSPRWLERVAPAVVLQSSGPARLYHDRWLPVIDPARVTRLITERLGAVRVEVSPGGAMKWSAFREGGWEAAVLVDAPAAPAGH